MKTVYKYHLLIEDNFTLSIPKGYQVLTVAVQKRPGVEIPCLWVLVDPEAELTPVNFRCAGTGHDITETNLTHIGSVLLYDDELVLHYFINN